MVRRTFSKLISYIKCFFGFVFNIPQFIKKQYHDFWQNLDNLKYNLKNIAEANTKLGMYHLNNQNYNDAIFRFKLVNRFFKPHDPKVQYWLGVTYFFKRNYSKALFHLEQGKNEDRLGLIDFVRELRGGRRPEVVWGGKEALLNTPGISNQVRDDNAISKVPTAIYSLQRDISARSFINRFDNKKDYDLPKDLIIKLITFIDDLPDEYSILDLGSNIGLLGWEIHKRMNNGFSLTGVESSQVMIDLQEIQLPEAKYDKVICASTEDFLLNQKEKYNVVVSLDGFATNSDLNGVFSKVYDALEMGGYFAFVVKASDDVSFNEKYLEFSYSKVYINSLLKQNELKILTWVELELAIQNNYFIFVCKK